MYSIVNDSTLILTLKLSPWKCETHHKLICYMPLKAESCQHEALQWQPLVICAKRLCKTSMQGVYSFRSDKIATQNALRDFAISSLLSAVPHAESSDKSPLKSHNHS